MKESKTVIYTALIRITAGAMPRKTAFKYVSTFPAEILQLHYNDLVNELHTSTFQRRGCLRRV